MFFPFNICIISFGHLYIHYGTLMFLLSRDHNGILEVHSVAMQGYKSRIYIVSEQTLFFPHSMGSKEEFTRLKINLDKCEWCVLLLSCRIVTKRATKVGCVTLIHRDPISRYVPHFRLLTYYCTAHCSCSVTLPK